MNINRRALLLGVSTLALGACSGASGATPAQIIADAQGILTGLQTANTAVAAIPGQKIDPPATAAKITSELTLGQSLLTTAAANLPTVPAGQALMTTILGYINDALDTLSAVTPAAAALFPGLAPAVPLIEAAVVLAPIIEAFIQPPTAGVATLRARDIGPVMTVDQARAVLGVKVV